MIILIIYYIIKLIKIMIKNKPSDNKKIRPFSSSINKKSSINFQQSPKFSSKKYRNIIIESSINNNRLFSLIDINDIRCIQKGTKLPKQYKRLNEKEFEEIYFKKKIKTIENDNKNINKIKTNITIKNKENNFKSYSNTNINYSEIKKPKSSKNLILKYQIPNQKNQLIPNLNLENINKNIEEKKHTIHTENDRYLPKNYIYYLKCVKNQSFFNNIILEKIKKHAPLQKHINYNEIKKQSLKSNIINENSYNKELNNKNKEKYKKSNIYLESDIFNINKIEHLNDFQEKKIGEKFLFNSPLTKSKLSNFAESNSNWEDKKLNVLKSINKSSVTYNILSPSSKNNYLNNQNVKLFNKTKGINEFEDLTRITSPNYNYEYQKKLNNNKFCFRKVKEVCSDYIESYSQGKDIFKNIFPKNEI